jgi:ribonuclease HI
VLFTRLDGQGQAGVGRGPTNGRYHLSSKSGRKDIRYKKHQGEHGHDEAEYLTLTEALTDLITRITSVGRDPSDYTVNVYSRRELVVKQLTGEYRVKSPTLAYAYAETKALLEKFKRANFTWKKSYEIGRLFSED